MMSVLEALIFLAEMLASLDVSSSSSPCKFGTLLSGRRRRGRLRR